MHIYTYRNPCRHVFTKIDSIAFAMSMFQANNAINTNYRYYN